LLGFTEADDMCSMTSNAKTAVVEGYLMPRREKDKMLPLLLLFLLLEKLSQ